MVGGGVATSIELNLKESPPPQLQMGGGFFSLRVFVYSAGACAAQITRFISARLEVQLPGVRVWSSNLPQSRQPLPHLLSLTVSRPRLLIHPLFLSTPSPSLGFRLVGGGGFRINS